MKPLNVSVLLLGVTLNLGRLGAARDKVLIDFCALADVFVLAVKINSALPSIDAAMSGNRYSGVDNFQADSGHHADLEYRGKSAAFLALHTTQDAFHLATAI